MEHEDFSIGMEFWTETGQWRCTDVGSRTICAISLEPSEMTTLHEDGSQTSSIDADPRRLSGPPYMVAEIVFDEDDFPALYRTREEQRLK